MVAIIRDRDRRSGRSSRGRVHQPIAQQQEADSAWRGKGASPIGIGNRKGHYSGDDRRSQAVDSAIQRGCGGH